MAYDPWIGSNYKFTNRGISHDGILNFYFVAWANLIFGLEVHRNDGR